MSRILPILTINRLKDAYEFTLDPNQCGFVANKGCDDAIFTIKNACEKYDDKFYMVFVDIKAAYDKIPRDLLFEVLKLRFNDSKLIDLMELYYKDTKTKVKYDSRKKDSYFPTESGCRQGAQEAPMFFNCYSDWVNRVASYEISRAVGDDFGIEIDYKIPSYCRKNVEIKKLKIPVESPFAIEKPGRDNEPSVSKWMANERKIDNFFTRNLHTFSLDQHYLQEEDDDIVDDSHKAGTLRIHWSPKFYHFCRNFYLQEVED